MSGYLAACKDIPFLKTVKSASLHAEHAVDFNAFSKVLLQDGGIFSSARSACKEYLSETML